MVLRWILVVLGLIVQVASLAPLYKAWQLGKKNKNVVNPPKSVKSKMVTTIITGAGMFGGGFLLWFIPTLLHGAGIM